MIILSLCYMCDDFTIHLSGCSFISFTYVMFCRLLFERVCLSSLSLSVTLPSPQERKTHHYGVREMRMTVRENEKTTPFPVRNHHHRWCLSLLPFLVTVWSLFMGRERNAMKVNETHPNLPFLPFKEMMLSLTPDQFSHRANLIWFNCMSDHH